MIVQSPMNQELSDYFDEISHFIHSRISNPQDADDLVQDVFYKASIKQHQLKDASKARAWLYRVARNAIIDHHRRHSSQPAFVEIDEQIYHPVDDTSEIANCVLKMFLQLETPYRQALLAVDVDEIPQNELSQQLHLSYSGTKSRIQRGREQLRHLLEAYCEAEVAAFQPKRLSICCSI